VPGVESSSVLRSPARMRKQHPLGRGTQRRAGSASGSALSDDIPVRSAQWAPWPPDADDGHRQP